MGPRSRDFDYPPQPTKKTRRERIINTTKDLMSDFLYYDRKEDENLPRGAIEEAVAAGEISIPEIMRLIEADLLNACGK